MGSITKFPATAAPGVGQQSASIIKSGRLPDTLTKNITPMINGVLFPTEQYTRGGGLTFFPRVDPVLNFLAMSDEREYRKMMRTDYSIGSAINQRITGLMSEGDQVLEGRAHTPASGIIREFVDNLLQTLKGFYRLRREVLQTTYLGWRPIEIQWEADAIRYKGRPYIGVRAMKSRRPWFYRYTLDEKLIQLSTQDGYEILDVDNDPDTRHRFMICKAGDSESPYGESWLQQLWLLYFISKQFEKMGSQAMQRALGILVAVRKHSGSNAVSPQIPATLIDKELRDVINGLNSNNVLVESQNYSLEVIEQTHLTQDLTRIFDYFNTQKRVAIVGQNLSSEVKGGSFAASKTHSEILENYYLADAFDEADWWNDGLIKHAIELNFGEIDEGDRPQWQSRIVQRPSLAASQTLFDMGASIDARKIADGFNAPLFVGKPGPDDVVVTRPPQVPGVGGPGGGALPFPLHAIPSAQEDQKVGSPDQDVKPSRLPLRAGADSVLRTVLERGADAEAAAADLAIHRAANAAADAVSSELARYYSGLEAAFKENYLDVKQ
jgi:hypothetical protein